MEEKLELPDRRKDYEEALQSFAQKSTPAERVQLAMYMSQMVKDASTAAIKWCNPEASDEEVKLLLIAHYYGQKLSDGVREHIAKRRLEALANADSTISDV